MTTISAAPETVVDQNGTVLLTAAAAEMPIDVWDALPRPCGWYIAVMQRRSPTMTRGGVYLPQTLQSDRECLDNIGRVIAMGPACYRHEDFMEVKAVTQPDGSVTYKRVLSHPRCTVGDWVLFMRHEQLAVPVYPEHAENSDADVQIRFTTDRAILARATHPDRLKVYLT